MKIITLRDGKERSLLRRQGIVARHRPNRT